MASVEQQLVFGNASEATRGRAAAGDREEMRVRASTFADWDWRTEHDLPHSILATGVMNTPRMPHRRGVQAEHPLLPGHKWSRARVP